MMTNSNETVISIRNLTKKFGRHIVVNNLNLRVYKGEIYGLLGPNGAGKTTLIKILCGLLKPDNGKGWILGKEIPPSEDIRCFISYMPQDIALYMDLTVQENLEYWGELYDMSFKTIRKMSTDLLKFVELEGFENKLVAELSGGMKRRLSLACCLIHQPQILFLDEPTVGVDPKLRISFWKYFTELTTQGKTIIITTHYMEEANHCNRVGLLHKGNLIAEGPPDGLKERTNTSTLEDAFLVISQNINSSIKGKVE